MSKTSVFCIAKSYPQAEQIVERLQSSGFPSSEISVLLPDTEGKHDIGHVKATKAPEGATTGAATGGLALTDVTVTGKSSFTNLADAENPAENLVGIAQSASQGAISARQLNARPVMRAGHQWTVQ